ncbi:MAG: F390 synthetase-related protein [Candidatus Hodarchaeota archaeon]
MADETSSFLKFFLGCKWRFKRATREKIEQYQLKNARNVVQFAVENAPFFKRHFDGHDIKDVWSLPTTNKKVMMDNLSEYTTLGFKKDEMLDFLLRVEKEKDFNTRFYGNSLAMSSGTSGSKGVVLTTPKEEKYLQAAFFARFPFPRTLKLNWAFILRITAPAFNVSKFGQRLTYISLLKPIEEIRRELEALNPNILSAPPSMLQIISRELDAGRLNIYPKRVVSYAEVLSSDVNVELERIFGKKIFQIYQSSEGPIGMPCGKGSLHLNEDLMCVQTLDSEGNPTPPGKPCYKLIVTDLHKKSQPVIRFELNDIIIISPEQCECGSQFRVVQDIMGRSDDMYWGQREDNDEYQYIFPDYIRRAIITSGDEIDDYQAVQKNFTNILVRLVLEPGIKDHEAINELIVKNIQEVFTSYNCVKPDVEILHEPPIKNPNSMKLIRIQRNFKFDK